LKVEPTGCSKTSVNNCESNAQYHRSAKTFFIQRRKPVKECLVHIYKKSFNILISVTFRHWYIDDSELVPINRVWVFVDKFHQ
jgi:hypothetical protein